MRMHRGPLAAVIGDPVQHSLSPEIFSFLQEIDPQFPQMTYVPLQIPPTDLSVALSLIKQLPFVGLNVTIPHKETILPLLDEVSLEAVQTGAVNVVRFEKGRSRGLNTDLWGIRQTLLEHELPLQGIRALVLGAGGAARAVGFILGAMGADKVYFMNRHILRGENLCRHLSSIFTKTHFQSLLWGREEAENLESISLLVHTTPLGLQEESLITSHSPFPYSFPFPQKAEKAWAFDLLYRPLQTPFLKIAAERDWQILHGLDMLIWQALYTVDLFFPQLNYKDDKKMKGVIGEHLLKKL